MRQISDNWWHFDDICWHPMTFDDIRWQSMTFDDNWWQMHDKCMTKEWQMGLFIILSSIVIFLSSVVIGCHRLSSNFIKFHQIVTWKKKYFFKSIFVLSFSFIVISLYLSFFIFNYSYYFMCLIFMTLIIFPILSKIKVNNIGYCEGIRESIEHEDSHRKKKNCLRKINFFVQVTIWWQSMTTDDNWWQKYDNWWQCYEKSHFAFFCHTFVMHLSSIVIKSHRLSSNVIECHRMSANVIEMSPIVRYLSLRDFQVSVETRLARIWSVRKTVMDIYICMF